MAKPKGKPTTKVKAKEAPTRSKDNKPVGVVVNSKDGSTLSGGGGGEVVSMSRSIVAILVAILALLAGIVTPTLWNRLDDYSSLYPLPLPLASSSIIQKTVVQQETPPLSQQERKTVETSTTTIPTTATTTTTEAIVPEYACTENVLADYLHDFSVPGLHVVCLHTNANAGDTNANANTNTLTMFKNAQHHTQTEHPQIQISVALKEDHSVGWTTLRDTLVEHLALTRTDDLHQPWAIYSPAGERLLDEVASDDHPVTRLQELGVFLIYQGGQWLWPPVRKGFQRHIQLDDTHNATLKTLSIYPLVFSVDGFLTPDECDYIQLKATPTMQYSSVSLMDHDQGRPSSDFRTSQSTFLSSFGDADLEAIDDRTASLVRLPKSHQEYAQVLRYGHKEKYDTHHDYFDPALYQKDPGTLRIIRNGRRNRMATVFWYLTDVQEGGETVFPRFDKGPNVPSSIACQRGLRVKPERGKVIIFYSFTPDGKTDTYSLHGACPVQEGVKWAANKWVWNEAMEYMR